MGNDALQSEVPDASQKAVQRARVVKVAPMSEVRNRRKWKEFFTFGHPAYIANPTYGACVIRARRSYVSSFSGRQVIWYLVNIVDPLPSEGSKLNPSRHLDKTKFYKVPAMVPVNDTFVNYVYPVKCIISGFHRNPLDPNASLLDIHTADTIDRITLKEFIDEIKSSPHHTPNKDYEKALTILQRSNPEIMMMDIGLTRTVSKAAQPYMIDHAASSSSIDAHIDASLLDYFKNANTETTLESDAFSNKVTKLAQKISIGSVLFSSPPSDKPFTFATEIDSLIKKS